MAVNPSTSWFLVDKREGGRVWVPRAYFKAEYGLGESGRKTGLRNLADLGVLIKHTKHIDDLGDTLARRRRRNVYDLPEEYARIPEPIAPAVPGAGHHDGWPGIPAPPGLG